MSIQHEANHILKDQMFALRHRAFFVRRNWEVNSRNEREHDDLDGPFTTYLIVCDDTSVLGSLRLIETTRDYMLTRYFPDLLGHDIAPRNAQTWECSRFCVDAKSSDIACSAVTKSLLYGMFRLAAYNGVTTIVGVMDTLMERIIRQQGCVGQRFGTSRQMDDGLVAVVKKFDVDESLAALEMRGISPLEVVSARHKLVVL